LLYKRARSSPPDPNWIIAINEATTVDVADDTADATECAAETDAENAARRAKESILPDPAIMDTSTPGPVEGNKEHCNIANFNRIIHYILPNLDLINYRILQMSSNADQRKFLTILTDIKKYIGCAQEARAQGEYVDCQRIFAEYNALYNAM